MAIGRVAIAAAAAAMPAQPLLSFKPLLGPHVLEDPVVKLQMLPGQQQGWLL